MGESAMISAPAALVNAVNVALAPFGVTLTEVPISPARVAGAIAAARR
jgi:CO/xanthine dehydrogenase Mo-binding subunit